LPAHNAGGEDPSTTRRFKIAGLVIGAVAAIGGLAQGVGSILDAILN